MSAIEKIIAELYKSESAKILAVLTRIFGTHNIDLAEDVMQEAFSKAMQHWPETNVPLNPSAWIIQSAKNQAIDTIRANKTKTKFASDLAHHLESEWSLVSRIEAEFNDINIRDDQLRMIFMCSSENINPENRLPFILRILCGLSITAISRALLITEANVKKRLFRTKQKLKNYVFELPDKPKLAASMDTVHTALYLLFNEGLYSSQNNLKINKQLCLDAIGLTKLLTDEPRVVNQDTFGLLALMYFNFARLPARTNQDGHSIPLDLQDRNLWEKDKITFGSQALEFAEQLIEGASGRFYHEAKIAEQHSIANSFAETDWQKIISLYTNLIDATQSPLAKLNQAVAFAYAGNVDLAIEITLKLKDDRNLQNSFQLSAAMAHFYAMQKNTEASNHWAENAKSNGGTPAEHAMMTLQLTRQLQLSN